MDKKPQKPQSAADIRKARLAEQLRANLQKRKAQGRARKAAETGESGADALPSAKRP